MLFVKKFITWILNFLHIQLFVTLIALPIVIAWGLPVSLLSPLGNLIFGPFLTVFLFLSSLLFFTEIVSIPNSWIAWSLDKSTDFWLYSMQIDGKPWLYGFAKPSWLILLAIPLAALAIIHCKQLKQTSRQVIALFVLLVGSCWFIKAWYAKNHTVDRLACNKGQVTLLYDNNQLTVIDPGVVGQRISAASWVEYTLVPHIIKTSGRTMIDHLIVLQPSAMTFEAVTTLLQKSTVKTLYLPCWQGSLAKNEWHRFFTMKDAALTHNTLITRLTYKTVKVADALTIEPLDTQIQYREISYRGYKVCGTIDKQALEICSYKTTEK